MYRVCMKTIAYVYSIIFNLHTMSNNIINRMSKKTRKCVKKSDYILKVIKTSNNKVILKQVIYFIIFNNYYYIDDKK